MKITLTLTALLFLAFTSCKKSDPISPSESFLPLQIGNYWRMDAETYIEITGTVQLNGKQFYKTFSLTGGDVLGELCYRIDEHQNLIESHERHPDYNFIVAKFNAKVGDSFQALGDKSVNDYKITVVEKTPTKMSFSYDMIYHPNLKGHPHVRSFVKGIGWDGWKIVKIGEKVYTF
jgi:hypothetical protein